MRLIKVIYNFETTFIKDIVSKFSKSNIIETYNIDITKEAKKANPIRTRFGTKEVPLIVFADENLEEIDAIWAETTPNWEEEIRKKLK